MSTSCVYHPSVISIIKCENCNKPICIMCIRKYITKPNIQYNYCTRCYNNENLKSCQCIII